MNRWFGLLTVVLLSVSLMLPSVAEAEKVRTIADESIYDLLVDRFNNANGQNDLNINAQDPQAFNGGDFAGVMDRLQHILDMGFTVISLGPVFETATYDGNEVLDYEELEPHFGTADEFNSMIEAIHAKDLKVIADFPLNGVSANHVWTDELATLPATDGTVNWDYADLAVRQAIQDAIVGFLNTYDLDGIRLTKIAGVDTAYLNELIAAIKEADPDAYVLANEETDAGFDLTPNAEEMNALRTSFVSFDADTSPLGIFTSEHRGQLIQVDDLTGPRYTYDIVEARMFPPTRWKLAAVALFTMPGVPLMPYGTEIAVNGEQAPESHPYMNFRTDMELKDYIADLNSLRNQSETFRSGEFELLYNEEGFIVYKISSPEETWIVALNNSAKTANTAIPVDVIGENKILRGLLDGDLIRESDDGLFRVVLERELAEIYIASEDEGFNTPYLIASILVYVLFLGFLFAVWRKGRQKKREEGSQI
ncbi:alpha-amylase family glycosyl hydrolase [Bacillus sp. OxB-1]|uniref:alpha-amylase family glycosyl hydrolase n=1 Tax=Bacillus sp. (strain OxB-1) TaxID=98228 RepID=UPI0005976170|nr:alpha-amylase family glycosyl hydrolase [Bacillus sp. OxB-1]